MKKTLTIATATLLFTSLLNASNNQTMPMLTFQKLDKNITKREFKHPKAPIDFNGTHFYLKPQMEHNGTHFYFTHPPRLPKDFNKSYPHFKNFELKDLNRTRFNGVK